MESNVRTAIERACERLAIEYGVCIDNGRFEDAAALFAREGVMRRMDGSVSTGREAIAKSLGARPADLVTVHHLSPVLVDVMSEKEARGISSFVLYVKDGKSTPTISLLVAFWHDIYLLSDDGWRIGERSTRVMMDHR